MPSLATIASNAALPAPTSTPSKNQTIISNRFPRQEHPLGKVKVVLQISHPQPAPTPYLKVDSSRKHLTLYDPTLLSSYEQNQRPTAPKMFAFDAIVNNNSAGSSGNCNSNSLELSKACLPELIDAVMNGNDSVLFALGKTGTQETMLATDGLMVYAINWLFAALKASKRRFAIKCSAAHISHTGIRDALAHHHSSSSTSSSPSTSLPPICTKISSKLLKTNTILSQLREMSCISPKRAAHCLDISANYNQTQHPPHNHTAAADTSSSSSTSLLYTLHVYQYQIISNTNGKNTVVGGRSRLHMFDLSPAVKNLTNVLLAIFNGQKHIPNK
ncbi:unnamed protein product [Oppiella nova]|uniref:Kinesin motor domain-containing protein n=1 Tax=Oppiella nova TaxID=334625 RepID=A0A7R9LAD1_9ACAR|nr:unnamed protein product [Oppiella nova]CAG2161547.1 unnamed protein product [Oppiella nova]